MNHSRQQKETQAGMLLIASAIAALLLANGPLAAAYEHALHFRMGPNLPRLGVPTIHQWISDGLMAVFFLLVGLEVKREWFDGRLSTPAERRIPLVAASAGMVAPAVVFLSITGFDAELYRGWAIPAATDIAFVVGVLALLGRRATPSLRLLLVAIAIVDDVGAVVIIAVFYTSTLDVAAIGVALLVTAIMAGMAMFGVRRLWPFVAGFALLWVAMLASGIHATIAGVIAAMTIPLGRGESRSPLKQMEHFIHPWVMFGVVPLFGLVSAGVHLGEGASALVQPLPMAVALGLFIGKPLGIFFAIWLVVRSTGSTRPPGATWWQILGGSILCGIGFTMSLFIGALAFPDQPAYIEAAKLGTLAGSVASALLGWTILRFARPAESPEDDVAEAGEIFSEDVERSR